MSLLPVEYEGARIVSATLIRDEELAISVEIGDGVGTIRIRDDGQNCCELRWITCDDDVGSFAGARLLSVEWRPGPKSIEGYDVYETAFVRVVTSRGDIVLCTHNQHNGYYGGFTPVVTPVCTARSHAAAKATAATWATWFLRGRQGDLELRDCPHCRSTLGKEVAP